MPRPTTVKQRSTVYAALGDPVRLRIVDELAASDRSPAELAEWLELPSNLLAHHLGVLADAGIVERVASSGDGRRRYVRLGPWALAGLWTPPFHVPSEALFICSHNSARSQLAAALWRERVGAPAQSAGTHPAARVHAGAVAAAERAGLDLHGAVPRDLGELTHLPPLVVTVCDRAHEELGPGASGWFHWSIPDPVPAGDGSAFDGVVALLGQRIERWLGRGPAPAN